MNLLSRLKDVSERYGFLILSLGFLLLAFKLLPDYGLGFDGPKNFNEGRINLDYLLTGQVSYDDQLLLIYQIHGAFFFMLSELSRRLFGDALGWLDRTPAHHILLPVLVFCFLNFFYAFLRKRVNAVTAFWACAALLVMPHFWGHTFHNIKDIPLLVFFSLSLLSFYKWYGSGLQKSRYLYGAFLLWGLALLSKIYAVLVPLIAAIWMVLLIFIPHSGEAVPVTDKNRNRRNLFSALFGLASIALLLVLFYMPAFYYLGEKKLILKIKDVVIQKFLLEGARRWSLLPFLQLFFVTPVLTSVAALGGLLKTFSQRPLLPLPLLMAVWFFVNLLTACTPLFPVYNGIRLYLVILVPFSFFAGYGILAAAEFLERISPVKKSVGCWLLGTLLVAVSAAGILQTHPYQTTFFNSFAGGLKGALKKRLPDAGDYWLTSYREAIRWVNANAPQGANVLVPNWFSDQLINYYKVRDDLYQDYVRRSFFPPNSFLILANASSVWINLDDQEEHVTREMIERETRRMVKVYEVRRQGGLLLAVYYKPAQNL